MSKVKLSRVASTRLSSPSKPKTPLRRVSSSVTPQHKVTYESRSESSRNSNTPTSEASSTPRCSTTSPVNIPIKQLRKKSILKNSVSASFDSDHTPASSPERNNGRRISQVRFLDDPNNDAIQSNKRRISRKKRVGSHNVFREISFNRTPRDRNKRCDWLSEDSDIDDPIGSHGLPSLHVSASMSPEAQYALLKTYEDQLYHKIHTLFPDIALRLKDETSERSKDENLDFENEENIVEEFRSSSPNAHKVAERLRRAMLILESVWGSGGDLKSGSCSEKTVEKEKMRSVEKLHRSLQDTLADLNLKLNMKS